MEGKQWGRGGAIACSQRKSVPAPCASRWQRVAEVSVGAVVEEAGGKARQQVAGRAVRHARGNGRAAVRRFSAQRAGITGAVNRNAGMSLIAQYGVGTEQCANLYAARRNQGLHSRCWWRRASWRVRLPNQTSVCPEPSIQSCSSFHQEFRYSIGIRCCRKKVREEGNGRGRLRCNEMASGILTLRAVVTPGLRHRSRAQARVESAGRAIMARRHASRRARLATERQWSRPAPSAAWHPAIRVACPARRAALMRCVVLRAPRRAPQYRSMFSAPGGYDMSAHAREAGNSTPRTH